MKKLYQEFKERIQKETNKLPIYWVFGKEQIDKLTKKLNLKNDGELKEKCFGIFGGLALKKDKEMILNTLKKHNEELKENLKNDDFLKSAFRYEMSNHEYIITYDIEDTLQALNITLEEYQKNERMQQLFKEAEEDYLKDMEAMGW